MTVTVLRWSNASLIPWSNGGGITREIARSQVGLDDFDWRISVADVPRSSEFSKFAGVDRVIVPLDEVAMVLTVDAVKRVVRPYEPFAFPGDATTSCVTGADRSHDLNVMTRRGRFVAEVMVRRATELLVEGVAGATTYVIPLTTPCHAELPDGSDGSDADGESDAAGALDLTVLDTLVLTGTSTALVTPRPAEPADHAWGTTPGIGAPIAVIRLAVASSEQ